ncbi:Transcriptional regulator GlxA family, contains an amidase domain and an AraC-type DNA-binding HTH domain [Krasilnikoviella flava]|uniref:Transcriptional regulator GlxA family, contains an amidase domain and an AraC-type DNA-binding HTH domain n=1 Tax=Krasilnikoviella flava TaxID=526729 RepID=A0A1T5KUR6_9MICO|nr:Transcriptional regulator GlxA family, contains an amidase domain and an AraC-type DNA-binding HTH domain [Krasilnikoviella flava]
MAGRPCRPPHRVAVLVRDGVMPLELGAVHQLFGTARGPGGERLYEVRTCAAVPGRVRSDADFALDVPHGPEALAVADTVVVPASHELDDTGAPDDEGTPAPGQVSLAELLATVRPDARIASICTGAFALARAGLLDGRRATTHWMSAERFRRAFPTVLLDPDVLYTEDGRVFTSAGEAAGIDLCLHLIRSDHGAAVANDVARRTVVPPFRDGGQAQYVDVPVPEPAGEHTGPARSWALEHLDEPLSLDDLARHAAMSTRTFTRRFRREVGVSPGAWLLQQRLLRARDLLERTDLPVDAVARRAGFGTGASLRQHFARALGVSPNGYRTTFGPGHRHEKVTHAHPRVP